MWSTYREGDEKAEEFHGQAFRISGTPEACTHFLHDHIALRGAAMLHLTPAQEKGRQEESYTEHSVQEKLTPPQKIQGMLFKRPRTKAAAAACFSVVRLTWTSYISSPAVCVLSMCFIHAATSPDVK